MFELPKKKLNPDISYSIGTQLPSLPPKLRTPKLQLLLCKAVHLPVLRIHYAVEKQKK